MILYFANRKMEILGLASTELRSGIMVTEDLKEEDVDTGIAAFSCTIYFDKESRLDLEEKAKVGNYLLRSNDGENEFYTIIENEIDTSKNTIYLYAEDAGLELLNEIALEYSADEAQDMTFYVNKYISGTGFEIGINESGTTKKRLAWTEEHTVTERLIDIADQFGGYEVSFSFEVSGLNVVHKYVNIYKERGKDAGISLRLNKEIDSIVTKKTVSNLATALLVTGASTDGGFVTNLEGYEYDDGDFYVDGHYLKSRNAVSVWGRYVNGKDVHVVKTFHYDTVDQEELFKQALEELKKVCDIEANYEVDIAELPENVKIGDRVNIVDDDGELYLSARILKLETSITDGTNKATIGDYLLKDSGVSQKVQDLADQFQELAQNRTLYTWIAYADDDQGNGISLDSDGKDYMGISANHTEETPDISDPSVYKWSKIKGDPGKDGDPGKPGEDGRSEVSNVTEYYLSTSNTEPSGGSWSEEMPEWEKGKYIWKRNKITWSDGNVTYTDPVMDTALNHANEAADYATEKAEEAETSASNANNSATIAQENAQLSAEAAANAQASADTANATAEEAKTTASAAQTAADEANAQVSIINGEISTIKEDQAAIREEMTTQITTVTETMEASYAKKTDVSTTEMNLRAEFTKSAAEIRSTMESDYAKKTDLTDVQSDLQTQITQNSESITSTAHAVETVQVDATDAKNKAEEAVSTASDAQTKAQAAVTAAQDAQDSADAATLAAQTAQTEATKAQTEADTAKKAATDAKAVADAAQTDLDAAKQNLTDVTSRVDATEEEIAAAQEAVNTAQKKADEANASAANAQTAADQAQVSADTAKQNAATAQATADTATANAAAAQTAADEARAEADKANEAVGNLANTVTTMDTKITQNAEAIELAATKEEVTERLSGYYTKTETDAAIKVASNNITLSISATYSTKDETIVSQEEEFYLSNSPTVLSGGSWQATQPEWTDGKYIWRRTLVTYGDGSTEYTPSETGVCITGNTGEQGDKGDPGADGKDGQMLYATCPTGASVQNKLATISDSSLLFNSLTSGDTVAVKFTCANTASNPKLNVGNRNGWSGAKAIYVNGSAMTSDYYWDAGATIQFVYDGTNWNVVDAGMLAKTKEIRAELSLKIDEENAVSVINASADVINLTGNRLIIDSDHFKLSEDGTMTATNGIFKGEIEATSITSLEKYRINDSEDDFIFARVAGRSGIGTPESASNYIVLGKAATSLAYQKGIGLIAPVTIFSEVNESDSGCSYNRDNIVAEINQTGDVDIARDLHVQNETTCFNGLFVSRICRPRADAGNVNLGSSDYPWYNLYLSHCVYYTNPPTGSGTAVYINSNGAIIKYSSDRKIKNSIEEVTDDVLNPKRLYDLPIWQYKYNNDAIEKGDDLYGKTVIGLMADEVEEIYPRAAAHDQYGRATSWNPNVMIPAMLALIQEQKKELTDLKTALVNASVF